MSGGKRYLLTKNGLAAVKAAEAAGQLYIIPDIMAGLFNTFPPGNTVLAALRRVAGRLKPKRS